MQKLFVATIRVAICADKDGIKNELGGAEEFFSRLLSENDVVFDWAYGHADNKFPEPELIEINEKKYDEGDLFLNRNRKGRGILTEMNKVKKCPYKMLPLLISDLTHDDARAYLETRLKDGPPKRRSKKG